MTTESQLKLYVPQLVLETLERCQDYLSPTPEEEDNIYVSPYNDPIVVGGQGTWGYEISKQLPDAGGHLRWRCGSGQHYS